MTCRLSIHTKLFGPSCPHGVVYSEVGRLQLLNQSHNLDSTVEGPQALVRGKEKKNINVWFALTCLMSISLPLVCVRVIMGVEVA